MSNHAIPIRKVFKWYSRHENKMYRDVKLIEDYIGNGYSILNKYYQKPERSMTLSSKL